MKYLTSESVKKLTREELIKVHDEAVIGIETNDGRLSSGSSAELDLYMDNSEITVNEMLNRMKNGLP